MKTNITSAIIILVLSIASAGTLQAQSAKEKITDSSLYASDNTPNKRIAADHVANNRSRARVYDSTLDNTAGAAAVAKRTLRASNKVNTQPISKRQKPATNNLESTSIQKHDSTRVNTGIVAAQ